MSENRVHLTTKQERFCREYVIDLNGTQAAIRSGYSKKTARFIASENLSKPNIQIRISELNKPIFAKLEIESDWILEQLKTTAINCLEKIETRIPLKKGILKDNEKQKYITLMLPIDVKQGLRALELLGKHKGLFAKQVDRNKEWKVTVRDFGDERIDSEDKL